MSAPPAFRAITGLSAVMILACAMFFVAFAAVIAPTFAKMFADMADPSTLPILTRVAMRPVTSLAALLFLGAGAAAGVARPHERPLVLSLTAGGGIVLAMGAMLALYLPIFAVAGAIK